MRDAPHIVPGPAEAERRDAVTALWRLAARANRESARDFRRLAQVIATHDPAHRDGPPRRRGRAA